jgi:o-succinylbenzoate synthase
MKFNFRPYERRFVRPVQTNHGVWEIREGIIISLDESVATLQQLETCYSQGWRQIFVIKPLIIGSPSKLRRICQQYQIDAVFSSVFETDIGRHAALQLANELSLQNRAVGFGVNHWFQE